MEIDPHEAAARLPAFAKNTHAEAFFGALNRALNDASLPDIASGGPAASELPLIYIVGVPRSGTTLLHQLMSRHLPVGYINNLVAHFWLRPSVGIALTRALLGDSAAEQIELRSRYGTTEGPYGPHEFGYFWRHWLRLDDQPTHHLDEHAQRAVDTVGLTRALEAEILASFGRPVLFKNVICGFHARLLMNVHPRSLFVHVTRSTAEVSRSILFARKERYGSFNTWWSLKPSTYPFRDVHADPAAEVVTQVRECLREFESELGRPEVHAVTITYAELCADPMGTLMLIRDRLKDIGCTIEVVGTVPTSITQSAGPRLPEALEYALGLALERPRV